MKVEELIAILNRFPMEAEVHVNGFSIFDIISRWSVYSNNIESKIDIEPWKFEMQKDTHDETAS